MTSPVCATVQRTWHVGTIPVLQLTITLPQLPSQRRFNRFYHLQQRAYLAYGQGALFPLAAAEFARCQQENRPFTCHQATMDVTITYQSDELLSLYTQSKDESGILRHGDTWDLGSGFPRTASSFFPGNRGYRRMLATQAMADIDRLEATGNALFYPQCKVSTLARRWNPRNFYLTEEGLVFFYQRHAIAPGVEGVVGFLHPLWESEG